MNSSLLTLGIFLVGLGAQILLLQVNLFRYFKKYPDAKLVQSKFIFRFENIDQIILPDLNEGMLLSATILFTYIYMRYFLEIFSAPQGLNILHYIIPSFISVFLPYLIVFFLLLSIIIGAFSFRLPAFLKFLSYCWFLICFTALFIFFMGKLTLYFETPLYIYRDPVTIFFTGFNAIPLLTYLISIRWLFPNKNKSVIEQIGLMIEKVEDKQLSLERTLITVGIEGGILLLNGWLKWLDDAALVGFFVATMPFLHYKPRRKIWRQNPKPELMK